MLINRKSIRRLIKKKSIRRLVKKIDSLIDRKKSICRPDENRFFDWLEIDLLIKKKLIYLSIQKKSILRLIERNRFFD